MRFANVVAACVLLASFCGAPRAQAQQQGFQIPGVPPSGDVKTLVTQYVAAFNAKDMQRLDALLHPKSLACITPESKSFYEDQMAIQWREPIAANYNARVVPVNEGNVKALASMMVVFPVKPTQEVDIDAQQGDDVWGTTIWLVRENGRLYDDQPCATDEYLKKYRDEAPARAKEEAHFQALAAQVKDPLRAQLVALLRQHETGQAETRYQAATGADLRTAARVMIELTPEARGTSPH